MTVALPKFSGTKKLITFLRAHKRVSVITFSWIVFFAFFLIPNWHEGPEPSYFLIFSAGFVTLIASQLFPDWLHSRPWGTIHPWEAAARLARGHRNSNSPPW